jgi:rare lipoprotein A
MRVLRVVTVLGLAGLVANCSGSGSKIDPKYGVAASPRVVAEGQPVPKGGGRRQVGKPYQVAGRTFVPTENKNYKAEGMASWYGSDFHGRLTANGEVFDRHSFTAAHPTLPLPSYVRVTNVANGRSMVVRVNDRGPFHGNRVLDVSRRTAEVLGFERLGTARVRVTYEGPASIEGSDDQRLLATYHDGQGGVPPTALAMAPTPAPVMAEAPAPAPQLAAMTTASHVPAGQASAASAPVPMPSPSPLMASAPAVPASFTRGPAVAKAAAPKPAPVRVAMIDTSAAPVAKASMSAPVPAARMTAPVPTPIAAPAPAATPTTVAASVETSNAAQRVSSVWAAVGEPLPLMNTPAPAGTALAISGAR